MLRTYFTHPSGMRPSEANLGVRLWPQSRLCRLLLCASNVRLVRTLGIVTLRHQPPNATGTMLVSIEDEYGTNQVIVWSRIREA